jgi:hypothetical protein
VKVKPCQNGLAISIRHIIKISYIVGVIEMAINLNLDQKNKLVNSSLRMQENIILIKTILKLGLLIWLIF